jgi:hypothetical protein
MVLALACITLTPAATLARVERDPVLMLHGHNPSGSVDCRRLDELVAQLRSADTGHAAYRFTGEVVPVAYYGGDTRARGDDWGDTHCRWWANLANHGSHGHVSPSGHRVLHGVRGHTNFTSIRHLAYHLAWFIHDRYTRRGIHVDIVGQSMGGLIASYALAASEALLPHFPRRLLVDDVVMLGTPLGGHDAELFSSDDRQTREMDKDSTLMAWLHEHAERPPRAGGPTDWTFVGSYRDGLIAAASTIGRRCTDDGCTRWLRAQHYVLYDTYLTDDGPVGVTHADYARLTGYARVFRARVWSDAAGTWSDDFVSPVRLIELALARHDW